MNKEMIDIITVIGDLVYGRGPTVTPADAVQEACEIMALVYKSIGDYSHAADGFCRKCPNSFTPETYRNEGRVFQYVRDAVLAKLRADGYTVAPGFDPVTGKAVTNDDAR